VLCQKCYRTALKYDKVLEQEKELLIFRENYKEEAIPVDWIKFNFSSGGSYSGYCISWLNKFTYHFGIT